MESIRFYILAVKTKHDDIKWNFVQRVINNRSYRDVKNREWCAKEVTSEFEFWKKKTKNLMKNFNSARNNFCCYFLKDIQHPFFSCIPNIVLYIKKKKKKITRWLILHPSYGFSFLFHIVFFSSICSLSLNLGSIHRLVN